MTRVARVSLLLALGLAAIQVVRPDRVNALPTAAEGLAGSLAVPPRVAALLHRSCYDCHSQEVRWPWWSEVAPASWLIASDVASARRRMDFSQWDPERGMERLDGVCELASTGEMPPWRYTLAHPGTRLTKDEAGVLCAWVQGLPRPR